MLGSAGRHLLRDGGDDAKKAAPPSATTAPEASFQAVADAAPEMLFASRAEGPVRRARSLRPDHEASTMDGRNSRGTPRPADLGDVSACRTDCIRLAIATVHTAWPKARRVLSGTSLRPVRSTNCDAASPATRLAALHEPSAVTSTATFNSSSILMVLGSSLQGSNRPRPAKWPAGATTTSLSHPILVVPDSVTPESS